MRSKRLKDTAHFSHKNITKPTITHTDKISAAITECAKTIKAMGSENGADKMKQLQHLTEKAIATNTDVASKLNLPAEQTRSKVRSASTVKEPWQDSPDPTSESNNQQEHPRSKF